MDLVTLPDPVLHQPGGEVLDFEAAREQALAMIDFARQLTEPSCVGLTAHQIGIPVRLFVWRVRGDATQWFAAANPELEILDNTLLRIEEGCLSVPNHWQTKPRARAVQLRFYDVLGRCENELVALDYHARIVQHEYDHTLGKLLTDRFEQPKAPPRPKSKKRKRKKVKR